MNILQENQIEIRKNTEKQLAYYEEIENFFENDNSAVLTKLRSFSLYVPRQVITDFLVKNELFKLIESTHGSILEFGVFNGQGLMSWAHFSTIYEPNNIGRKIYGFDTFEGFVGVNEKDAKSSSHTVIDGGYAIDSYSRLHESINLFDSNRFIGHIPKIELIKGDVCETLPIFLEENPHVIAALVYLDMDIYKPTKAVLELILSRVPKGGIVAFDEVNLKDFPGETVALLETLKINKIPLKRLSFCSRISYFIME